MTRSADWLEGLRSHGQAGNFSVTNRGKDGLWWIFLLAVSCATPSSRREVITRQSLGLQSDATGLFNVCWREGAANRVRLDFHPGEVLFEAEDKSQGRCVREIASFFPYEAARPSGEVQVELKPPEGWHVLDWVRLLDANQASEPRGLDNPAEYVAGCLQKGTVRAEARFVIDWSPALRVSVTPLAAMNDSERCVESVLGATAWPSTKAFVLQFKPGRTSTADVSMYFAGNGGALPTAEPPQVKAAIQTTKASVAACWEAAMRRRAGLSGGRTVRVRTRSDGQVERVTVMANRSDVVRDAADFLLDACLVTAVGKIQLVGAAEATYSWVFADRAAQ